MVVDDAQAETTGTWEASTNLKPYAGAGYRVSSDPLASARFVFDVKTAGRYEVRALWQPHESRSKAAPVTVQAADGPRELKVDQSAASRFPDGSHLLGVFGFKPGLPAGVTFRATGGKEKIHIDAVQLVPAP